MEKHYRVTCGHDGCGESSFYGYRNRKGVIELQEKYGSGKWKCIRHSNPDLMLSVENLKNEKVLTSGKSKKYPNLDGTFWDDGSGFIAGPGFRAYSDDFPSGTKIVITAEIILPS